MKHLALNKKQNIFALPLFPFSLVRMQWGCNIAQYSVNSLGTYAERALLEVIQYKHFMFLVIVWDRVWLWLIIMTFVSCALQLYFIPDWVPLEKSNINYIRANIRCPFWFCQHSAASDAFHKPYWLTSDTTHALFLAKQILAGGPVCQAFCT